MTPWLLPFVPLAGAFAVLAASWTTRHRAADRTAVLTGIALATLAATVAIGGWAARSAPVAPWSLWGPRFAPVLAVEGLGCTMVVLVPLIAFPVTLYAGATARSDPGLPRLLALLVGFTGAMELLVAAGDFLTLLLAWELVGAMSWALIAYEWQDVERLRSARTAFLATRTGDLGLYLAAASILGATGTLRFGALADVHGPALAIVAGGLLFAAAAKSAQLPFAPWLFSAMAGPVPASALLHSATMVAAGAYLLARMTPMMAEAAWFAPAVAGVGLATALAGGVVASLQSDLKRVLAASTSAQYGMMLVAIGAGFSGAAGVHLVAHAATKALLFLAAGVAAHAAGSRDLDILERRGIAARLPRLSALAAVGALSLAAVPPLGGAYSKEQLVAAAAAAPFAGRWLEAGMYAAALLGGFYAARLWLLGFGGTRQRPAGATAAARTPRAEFWALGLLGVLVVGMGAWYLPGTSRTVAAIAGGRLPAAEPWWLVAFSILPVVIGTGAAYLLHRRGRLGSLGLPVALRARTADWIGIPALAQSTVVAPTVWLARALARVDDRAVAAGIRASAHAAALLSRALAWWGERGTAGAIAASARATRRAARALRLVDDQGLDRFVHGLAAGVGGAGARSRRLQTGLTHDYYRMIALGFAVVVLVLTAAVLAYGGPT